MSDLVRKSVGFRSRKSRATGSTLGNEGTMEALRSAAHRNALRERDLSACSIADAGGSQAFTKQGRAWMKRRDETPLERAHRSLTLAQWHAVHKICAPGLVSSKRFIHGVRPG